MDHGGTSNPQAKCAHVFNTKIQGNDSWKGRHNTRFDIYSKVIGIDNRCSACISHDKGDFIQDSITKTSKQIIGFGGNRHRNVMQGTIRWNIMDDEGETHEFIINNSYLVPEGGTRLLSPQHWEKEYKKQTGNQAYESTTEDEIILHWNNGKIGELHGYQKTAMWEIYQQEKDIQPLMKEQLHCQ